MIKKIVACVICLSMALCAASSCVTAAAKTASAKTTAKAATVKSSAAEPKTAGQTDSPLSLKAKSAVLMEASTGKILYESNPHEKMEPASITKIMTELLVLEAIENGSLHWTDKISCSEHASSMGGSDIWLKPGEVMTVEELFKAMAIGSANDAAVALAEKVGGTEKAFVNMMNDKAKQLGMKDTTFVNANGLDAEGHLSSAYDVALMSRELIKHKKIFDYCTVWMEPLRGGKTMLYNTNKMLRTYQGINGLKTGSTGKAGWCVSATAKRGNMQLIGVIMGSATSKERFDAASDLLDYGFTNWTVVQPKLNPGKLTVKVLRGVSQSVEAVPSGNTSILTDKSSENKIEQKIGLVPDVMAPVEKGQVLGQIYLTANGKNVGSVPIVAKTSVARMTFLTAFCKFFTAMVSG